MKARIASIAAYLAIWSIGIAVKLKLPKMSPIEIGLYIAAIIHLAHMAYNKTKATLSKNF